MNLVTSAEFPITYPGCDCSLFEVVDQVAPGLGAEYAAVYRSGVHVQQHLGYLHTQNHHVLAVVPSDLCATTL